MLNLVLVEAALETVPLDIQRHPSVRRNARRRRKKPTETLLDRSLHHVAMKGLPKAHKRGRPDIVHFCMLEALGSPLNLGGGLRLWIHTVSSLAVKIAPEIRLPRDYIRFKSLMEQLFVEGLIPPKSERSLMSIQRITLNELVKRNKATKTVALTSHGRPDTLEAICERLSEEENPTVFIGAYPSGPMDTETLSLADEALSIYSGVLDAWVIVSRLIYEFEKVLKKT
jgi:rRNA small subunit pseudouridine methyltransferase Nep1